MSSQFYPNGLKHFAQGNVVWKASGGSTIKVTLIDAADYTYSSSHEYMNLDTVPAAAKIATGTLTLIDAATGGVLDANDISIAGVTGDTFEAAIIWKDGGGGGTTQSGTTDLLLLYIDSASSGLPFTPNGGACNITWDNGSNKIGVI